METPLEDAVLASIKSTFTVEGQTFDTKEEAEKHLQKEQKIKEASKKLECFFKRSSIPLNFGVWLSETMKIFLTNEA